MAASSLQVLSFFFLTLFGGCLASGRGYSYISKEQTVRGKCEIDRLGPLDPISRVEYEAGYSEFWDENNEQLRCAGGAVSRHVVKSHGLYIPGFYNVPIIAFVVQGNGTLGMMIPGCPETYQSIQQRVEGEQGQMFTDQHQKLRRLYPGDVIVIPTGVAHWVYNNGDDDDDLVLIVVHDTSNLDNQLDQNLRRFFLAGNPQEQSSHQGINVLQVFDTEILARVFMVSLRTAEKLQSKNDTRGRIIRVQNDRLRMVIPGTEQPEERPSDVADGLEETICTLRLKENLANPERADIYVANGGSISSLNSLNLPILKNLQLSAGWGVLRPGAIVTPHWNLISHSISFFTRGSARVQVVGQSTAPVFDGEVKAGQLLIIPQSFAHFKQAGQVGCEWFTVKTNDQAYISPLAGKTSVIRALPEEVLMNIYDRLTREEARAIKYNRQEVTILTPQSPQSELEDEKRSIPLKSGA